MVLKQRYIFFIHCENFNTQRQTLFDKIAIKAANTVTENGNSIVNTLLFGKPDSENPSIKQYETDQLNLFYNWRDLIINYSKGK